jgi:hypothetical protein
MKMNTTADVGAEEFGSQYRRGSCAGRMNKKPWSIYEVGAVISGFAIFWPLGLLALFLKLKKGEIWNGASNMQAPWNANWASWKKPEGFGDFSRSWKPSHTTGNHAFDEYRKDALEKLEAERRKLDEERTHFDEFLAKLRRAKDQEAFERFMSERNTPPTTAN